MFRTEPRSKLRFVPRQAPGCCKIFLAHLGDRVDGGGGGGRPGKARMCSQQLQILITPKRSGLSVSAQQLANPNSARTASPLDIDHPPKCARVSGYQRRRPLDTSFQIAPSLEAV